MSISLKKGQGVSLKKEQYDLSQVTIGLGWDVNEEKKGFMSKLFSKAEDYDLDVVAFLLNDQGKITNLGPRSNNQPTLVNSDVIFFNNLNHSSGKIRLTGDNRTGDGDGDDEQIIINLNTFPDQFSKIVFVVQIYKGKELNQHFGKVKNAFIRAVDAKNVEILKYDLSLDSSFDQKRSMIFAELTRENGGWKFDAIGTPSESDTFVSYLKNYV